MFSDSESSISSDYDDGVYCICRKGYSEKYFMIQCDNCEEWLVKDMLHFYKTIIDLTL